MRDLSGKSPPRVGENRYKIWVRCKKPEYSEEIHYEDGKDPLEAYGRLVDKLAERQPKISLIHQVDITGW